MSAQIIERMAVGLAPRAGHAGDEDRVVEATVLGTDCQPIPRALVDVWPADARGRYDNAG